MNTKRLLFYWITSFTIAVTMYYVLKVGFTDNRVFGSWFRMMQYHTDNPISFITFPVFFYGIIANYFADNFAKKSRKGQLYLTLIIVILTILVSSPFGGMLWHYYDMKAGWFPKNWDDKLFGGFSEGLRTGWLIILLSFPYNIFGIAVAYFLTKKGSSIKQSIIN